MRPISLRKPSRLVQFYLVGLLMIASASIAVSPPAAYAADAPINIVSSGTIYTGSASDPVVISTLTRAPNGDLLAFFNTGGDVEANVRVRMTKSTDDGATWSTPTDFVTPSASGRRVSGGWATTLSDGTILMPYNDQHIVHAYLNRQNDLYIARSTDNGASWSGMTSPITIGSGWYFAYQFGEIVELADGTLLMPIWGQPDPPSTTTYSALNPEPYLSGVVRSTDNGLTWGDFSPFGFDKFSPERPIAGGSPSGLNEGTVTQLEDGRLMAMVRYDSVTRSRMGFITYSGDGGLTWSDPLYTGMPARGGALFVADCSSSMAGNRTKLIYASADGSSLKFYTSYDGGLSFRNATSAQLPSGASNPIYADAVLRDDGKMFVLFTGANRLMYNVIDPSTSAECATEAASDDATTDASRHVFMQRADRDGWDFGFARNEKTYASSTPMGTVLYDAAHSLALANEPPSATLYKNGIPLPKTGTLAEAGVVNGDVLTLNEAPRPAASPRVGFADYDKKPLTRRAGNFDDSPGFHVALDIYSRSLVVQQDLATGSQIDSVSVRDSDGSNGLTGSNTTVYSSADGKNWTALTSTTFSAAVVGGRKVVTFGNLNSSDPYIKIKFTNAPSGYTFVVDSRYDISVSVSP